MKLFTSSDPWALSLHVIIRYGTPDREAVGFVVKWVRRPNGLIFSEREGAYRRSIRIGRFYARTFARKVA